MPLFSGSIFRVPITQLPFIHWQARRLGHNFKELLDKYGEGEIPTEEMVEKLMKNTIKDDEIVLPRIYPPEREHQLSSIFVDTDTPLVKINPGCFISPLTYLFSDESDKSYIFYRDVMALEALLPYV